MLTFAAVSSKNTLDRPDFGCFDGLHFPRFVRSIEEGDQPHGSKVQNNRHVGHHLNYPNRRRRCTGLRLLYDILRAHTVMATPDGTLSIDSELGGVVLMITRIASMQSSKHLDCGDQGALRPRSEGRN
jgi:hypothetical protein